MTDPKTTTKDPWTEILDHSPEGPRHLYDDTEETEGTEKTEEAEIDPALLRSILCVETVEEEFARENGLTSYADLVNPF